jgi:hypothetical protein
MSTTDYQSLAGFAALSDARVLMSAVEDGAIFRDLAWTRGLEGEHYNLVLTLATALHTAVGAFCGLPEVQFGPEEALSMVFARMEAALPDVGPDALDALGF